MTASLRQGSYIFYCIVQRDHALYGVVPLCPRMIFPQMLATHWRPVNAMQNSLMIVDDSYIVRRVIRDFFDALTGWKIVGEAGDGIEAIDKAMELKPDLILLDFSMPKMNGIETASVIKKAMPNIYIVIFTMYSDALGSALTSAVGVDLVVAKADGLTELVKTVQRLTGTARLTNGETNGKSQEPNSTEDL